LLKTGLPAYALILLLALGACRAAEQASVQAGDPEVLSNLAMWEGHRFLKQDRPDLAADSFRKAADYMRTSPYPHFLLAKLYFRRSLMNAVLEFGTGVKLLLADFSYQSLLVANILLAALIAVAISMYLAVFVILARHARTVWFSALLTLSPRLGEKYVKIVIAGAVVCFLIALSGLSIVAMATWTAVIGCGLAWRYASASERKMIIGFGVFLIALVPAFDITARVVSTQHPGSPTKIAARAGETTEAEFTRAAETNNILAENDPIGEFMRGMLYLKSADYSLAIEHFNIASKFTHNNGAILNNIAIAFHNLGKYKEAQTTFENALKFAPREALIHYNYSQTLNALMYYDLAQNELTKASSLDFDMTRSLVTAKDKVELVPMNLANGVLWELAMDPANRILRAGYHPTEGGWPGVMLLCLLTGAGVVMMRNARLPARCYVCDAVVKAQVAKRKRREVICPECRAIKQSNAEDQDTLEKNIEGRVTKLEMHRSILAIVLGLVLPGCAYHLLGSKAKGLVMSVAVFILAVFVASGGGPMRPEPQLNVGRGAAGAVILFLIVYAVCAWRSIALVARKGEEE
jgi:tetratricopeptide (TPR) repeat protein